MMQVDGIDVEMRNVWFPSSARGLFLPRLWEPLQRFVNCNAFFVFRFSHSALTSQADEDGECSFKSNYGASTGAE